MNIMLNMEEGTFEQIEETTEVTETQELQELKEMLVDIKKDLDMIKDYLVGRDIFVNFEHNEDFLRKKGNLKSPLEEEVNRKYRKRELIYKHTRQKLEKELEELRV